MYTFLLYCVTVTPWMYLPWFLVILLFKNFGARLDKLYSDSTQPLVLCLSVICQLLAHLQLETRSTQTKGPRGSAAPSYGDQSQWVHLQNSPIAKAQEACWKKG